MKYLSDNIVNILILILVVFLIVIVFQDNSNTKKEDFNDVYYSKILSLFDYKQDPKSKLGSNYEIPIEDASRVYHDTTKSKVKNDIISETLDKIILLNKNHLDQIRNKLNQYEIENDTDEYNSLINFIDDLEDRGNEDESGNLSKESFYGIYKIHYKYKDLQDFYLYYGVDKTGKKRFSILNGINPQDIQFTFLINDDEVQQNMPTNTVKIDLIKIPGSSYEYTSNNPKSNKVKKLLKFLGVNLNGGVFYLRQYPNSNKHSLYNHLKSSVFHMTKLESDPLFTTTSSV